MSTVRAQKINLDLVPYSKKQKMLSTWWMDQISPHARKDLIVVDGAVRSGKTIIGSMSFIMWAMLNFKNKNFGIAGKSLDTLKRNLWVPLQPWFEDAGITVLKLKDTTNGYILRYSYRSDQSEGLINKVKLKLKGDTDHAIGHKRVIKDRTTGKTDNIITKENYFYLFSGKDESSASFVQGFTGAGFLFDEVSLMPESFVDESIARCSVEDAKLWFFCNADSPYHWFYTKWVLKTKEKNGLRMQFKMQDNLSLSKKTLARYESQWDGVFKRRKIYGEWVVAEGSIYTIFTSNEEDYYLDKERITPKGIYLKDGSFEKFEYINIGVDWGGTKSGHSMSAVAITKDFKYLVLLASEWHKAEGTTADDVTLIITNFANRIKNKYGFVDDIYCDSAEQILINSLRSRTDFAVRNARKERINDRINATLLLMGQHRLHIVEQECKSVIDFFRAAVWDAKSKTEDKRLDDGSYDVDSGDAFEYAFERYIPYLIDQ